jgi:hypothetical protein
MNGRLFIRRGQARFMPWPIRSPGHNPNLHLLQKSLSTLIPRVRQGYLSHKKRPRERGLEAVGGLVEAAGSSNDYGYQDEAAD